MTQPEQEKLNDIRNAVKEFANLVGSVEAPTLTISVGFHSIVEARYFLMSFNGEGNLNQCKNYCYRNLSYPKSGINFALFAYHKEEAEVE